MRSALILVPALVLALMAPAALAAPLASVGIGPGGRIVTADDGAPYYLLLHLGFPEAPREGQPKDDCSFDPERPDARAPPLEVALLTLVQDVAAWDPREEPRVSGWYPRCFAGTLNGSAATQGAVAYDVPTGRYYLHAETELLAFLMDADTPFFGRAGGIVPLGFQATTELTLAGSLGLGSEADCEGCPPPTG